MAGIVPKKPGSGRKQWTLHGGQKNSLKRLRNQMASDGCPESQVVLAKQLLEEECEFESTRNENAELGVYWLIKASQQGNLEATDLLKQCLQNGRGITDHNYMDVKSCISMTQDEKMARRAAKEMFASLSDGREYITSMQLQRKILLTVEGGDVTTSKHSYHSYQQDELGYRAPASDGERPSSSNGNLLDGYRSNPEEGDYEMEEEEVLLRPSGDISNSNTRDTGVDWPKRCRDTPFDAANHKLTEDHVVTAAVDYSHGVLPAVTNTLCLLDPDPKALDRIPLVQRSILHPLLALHILYLNLIRYLGVKSFSLLSLMRSELQLMLLLVVYTIFSADNVIYLIPMLLYYSSFVVMVCSTFRCLQDRRELTEYRMWSSLFITYSGGGLNSEHLEHQYIRNNLRPYGHFFLALLVNLLVYPIISDRWIPQSELTVVSFLLTFTTLLGLMPKRGRRRQRKITLDPLTLFSFAVNVLAKYPYETDPVVAEGWRFLDLHIPTFPSYVIGNGIEFCINFKLLLYALIPCILLKMAAREQWKGTYKYLIPHCITLSWLQVCIISAEGATMMGMLRGTLALVGVVLFLPMLGITSVLLPVLALTKWLVTSTSLLYSVCMFVALSGIGLAVCYLLAKTRYSRYTAVVQIVLMIAAFYFLVTSTPVQEKQHHAHHEKKPEQTLQWEVFQRFCHQPVWQDENVAAYQIKCHELMGSVVHWNGYINDIKIRTIRNRYKTLFDTLLPRKLASYAYCWYGDKINENCSKFSELAKEDCESFHDAVRSANGHDCTLTKYDAYTFEVTLRMASGMWSKAPEVVLIADDYFRSFLLQLKPTDRVWFKGQLINDESSGADAILGGLRPHVRPSELGCISCQVPRLTQIKMPQHDHSTVTTVRDLLDLLRVGTKFVGNALFRPIFIFK
nr:unnamed protein product [Callosobruchus analis]